jgi:hypothetical protein
MKTFSLCTYPWWNSLLRIGLSPSLPPLSCTDHHWSRNLRSRKIHIKSCTEEYVLRTTFLNHDKRSTLKSGAAVRVQEHDAVLIKWVGYVCRGIGWERIAVFVIGGLWTWLVVSKFFLRVCQLRFIHRSLKTFALGSYRHFPSIDLYKFTVVLLHLFWQVLFVFWHWLKQRNALLMRLYYNLRGTFFSWMFT